MTRQEMKYGIFACRLFIGALFIFASIHKITDPLEFAVSIRNYTILAPSWTNLLALTLPWVELLAGVFLILGIQTKPAALLTTTMLAVFLTALVYAFSIGLDIDCGCFSASSSSEGRVGIYHLVRDTFLVVVSGCILLFDREDFSIGRILSGYLRSEPTRA